MPTALREHVIRQKNMTTQGSGHAPPPKETHCMDDQPVPRRRWPAFAAGFIVGLIVGIPLGAMGLIVLIQVVTVMISP